jgi:hypothetical protein
MTIHEVHADFQAWLGDEAEVTDVDGVELYLELKAEQLDPDPCRWTCSEVERLVQELAPAVLPDDEVLDESMPEALRDFLKFLHATGRFRPDSDPYDDLCHALDRAMTELEERQEWEEANAPILEMRAELASSVRRERGDLPAELTGPAAATRLVADLLGLRELVKKGLRVSALLFPEDLDQVSADLGLSGSDDAMRLWHTAFLLRWFRVADGQAFLTDAADNAPADETTLAETWRAAILRYLRDSGAGYEWGYDDWLTVNTVLLKLHVDGDQSLGELSSWLDADDAGMRGVVPPLEYTGLTRAEGGRLTITDLGRWFVHQHNGASVAVDDDFADEPDSEFEPLERAVHELTLKLGRMPKPASLSSSEEGALVRTTPMVRHLLGLRELLRTGLRVAKDQRPTPESTAQIVEALGLLPSTPEEPGMLDLVWNILEKLEWVTYKSKQARRSWAANQFDPDSDRKLADIAHTALHYVLETIDEGWPFDADVADVVLLRLYVEPDGLSFDELATWLEPVVHPDTTGWSRDTLRQTLVHRLRWAATDLEYAGVAELDGEQLRLAPPGRQFVVDHFGHGKDPEPGIEPAAVVGLSAEALIKACLSDLDRTDELEEAWRRDREPEAAARGLAAGVGAPTAVAYREALADPVLRPFVQLCLIHAGLTDLSQAEGYLGEVWRTDLRPAVRLLEEVADGHPDKAIRKSARKSLYKARSRPT